MAPDEVKILEKLKSSPDIIYIIFCAYTKENGIRRLSYKLTGLEHDLNLTPEIIDIHINNLISLNILKDNEGSWRVQKNLYDDIISLYNKAEERYLDNLNNGNLEGCVRVEIEKSFYSLTSLGRTFIEACTNE